MTKFLVLTDTHFFKSSQGAKGKAYDQYMLTLAFSSKPHSVQQSSWCGCRLLFLIPLYQRKGVG